ncbi:DUF1367 family protein [Klebsiella pneumoniae]|uniref:DUF1367 family protein n=1 Tax=Klebsiella pneumoniae TaxID=573 RepID=A0A939NNV6_KLEPN|nr:DUF1367 family protein [Klebsiella pneumoniae]
MAQTLQFEKSYQNVLIPAEPGTSEYLQLIPVGQLLCGEFRKPRNYAFHKKFFKLLTLGYHYWTPSGGLIEPAERTLISGFIDFLSSDFDQRAALQNAAEMYLLGRYLPFPRYGAAETLRILPRVGNHSSWLYDEYQMPDGSRRRVAKSISFASMDDSQFNGVYKSVLNVLWNYILRRKFHSPAEAENAASQLLSFAG